MITIIKMAYRNLGRNRTRTLFSALAVAVSLAIIMLASGILRSEVEDSLDNAIRLQSGHLQVRSDKYNENKASLKFESLLEHPSALAQKIAGLPEVRFATPRLYASGYVTVGGESNGARIFGVDPASEANKPYRDGVIAGQWLTAEDGKGIVLGKALAEKIHAKTGDQINLSVNTSNGNIDEQSFVVRGIYDTNTSSFDGVVVFLPIAKAQSIAQTGDRASTIFIMLQGMDQADGVAKQLAAPGVEVLTWAKMNDMLVELETFAGSYMTGMYLIVLAIAASVVVNTLLMSVFERTREIGILSSIGMKAGWIMGLFLTETAFIGLLGIAAGFLLGYLAVANFSMYIGNFGLTGISIANTLHAKFAIQDGLNLALMTLIVTLISGIYPSIIAARLEPVEALKAEK